MAMEPVLKITKQDKLNASVIRDSQTMDMITVQDAEIHCSPILTVRLEIGLLSSLK